MPDRDDDDALTMAALAASAATVVHLQMMAQCLGDSLGVATAEKGGPTLSGEEREFFLEFEVDDDESSEEEAHPHRTKRTRLSYARPGYSASVWGVMLETMRILQEAHQLHPACSQAEEFRRNFRVPYEFFLLLVEVVRPWFGPVTRDVAQRECVPVTLKVLGVLYVLGRGSCCLGKIHEMSLMSRSTAAKALLDFCEHFSTKHYDAWVHLPEGENLVEVEKQFRERGFPGAVGSTGCMCVARARCPPHDAPAHTGKEGFPSWKYSVTIDLDGRILASTKESPGGVDEKAMVRDDASVLQVQNESPWATLTFSLCEESGKEVEHIGGWLVVNGDCDRQWKTRMCPIKTPSNEDERRWNERLKSVRDDAERLLARLRGRFRLLKTRVKNSPERMDHAWLTCCILHNMLLRFDDLEVLEVGMDWAGEDGVPEIGTEPILVCATPDADGKEGEEEEEEKEGPQVSENGPAFEEFRAKLVGHLAYKLKLGEMG